MPDSGFGSISLPGRAAANQTLGRGGQAVQIVKLPSNLNNVAKALRLSGEITQLSTNGVVRIATAEGNIEAQIRNPRGAQGTLQTGQQIDVEIPVGRPPQQATLKPPTIRENAGVRDQQATPRTSQTPQNITTPNTPRQSGTPRDNFVRQDQNFSRPENIRLQNIQNTQLPHNIQGEATRPAPQTQAAPLKQEAIVRLLAVPPAQAQKIATEFAQTLNVQPAALTRVPATANFVAENSQTQILNAALQIKNPSSVPHISSLPIQGTQITAPLLANTNILFQTQTTFQATLAPQKVGIPVTTNIQQTLIAPQPNPAQPIQSGALLPPQSAQQLLQNTTAPSLSASITTPTATAQSGPNIPLQQPVQTTLTPVPITFDPANPTAIQNTKFAKIDIQIVTIQPPQPSLTTPSPSSIIPAAPNTAPAQPPQIIPAATNFVPPILNTNNNAVTLTAQVTGFTNQGLPLVTIPVTGRSLPQSFIVQFNSNNLQLGSRLQITTQNPVLIQAAQPANAAWRGFQWQAINQLYNTLLQISPQAAASLTRSLPTPTSANQIAPAAMMFIAAVKSGDIAQFIGQNKADMVQRAGREHILRSLSQDSSQAARATEPASSGEWRAVPLPMFWEGEIQKINLYTREEFKEDHQKENKDNGQTRFIFDLDLSRMGEMQIDGYLKDQRLDLIIRSQNTFSAPMQQTMRQAYSNALDQTALSGELNFQGSTKNWVHVLEQEEQLGVNV